MRWLAAAALTACFSMANAAPDDADRLCRLVAAEAGALRGIAPDAAELDRSPTREGQLALFREVMSGPVDAPCRAARLAQSAAATADSPAGTMRWLMALGGATPLLPTLAPRVSAVDPLAAALDSLQPEASASDRAWAPSLPSVEQLPEPLRRELALLISAIGSAQRQLDLATRRLPASVDAANLRAQVLNGAPPRSPDEDALHLLPLLDRERLAQGMLDLVAGVERFARFIADAGTLPAFDWRLDTPLGELIVDTTGRDNAYSLAAPLLLVDVGGNDRYRFTAAPPARRVSVLVDLGGNDHYLAAVNGADPSAATIGYGVLWDSMGDDIYEGLRFAQAAAVFGAAQLVDGGGTNRFDAEGHAQGYAFGGFALLLADGGGNDRYGAVTHAQGSAGPHAVAALVDRAGDDVYSLQAAPLLQPSPQLPTHNTSMGQGAGRGLRPSAGSEGAAGGIGLLIDLAGDDRYQAQVFAQGAGFYEALGILVDAGGSDIFDAAWYAMGAAAHAAAGVLVKLGSGADRYRATHSTSLGAAHDHSVAAFIDLDGDDTYALGDLGIGASHECGVALFIDGGGSNHYRVEARPCRAFGWTQAESRDDAQVRLGPRTPAEALAVFADRGCESAAGGCFRSCLRAGWTGSTVRHGGTADPTLGHGSK